VRSRADWSLAEWIVCGLCLAAATSCIVFMVLYKPSWTLLLLLYGAGLILLGMSWAPGLLLKPTVPTSPSDMEPVAIPKIASFALALGTYCLLGGAILVWILG
jgi:hypothetical protein